MSRARDLSKLGNINTFAVDSADTQVGIASTVPNATLDVGGDGVFTGIVTATSFSGSGSGLTGVANTDYVVSVASTTGLLNVTGTTDSTSSTTGAVTIAGGVGIAKNVYIGAGLSIAGTLTYEDVTNVDSVGLITAKSGLNVSGGEVTVGSGLTVASTSGVATFADGGSASSNALHFGSGGDLTIHHDGSNTFIDNNTGYLNIKSTSGTLYLDGSNINLRSGDGGETYAVCNDDGAVEIYHNNVKTFETIGNGIRVLGTENDAAYIYMSADEGDDNADKWVHKVATTGQYSIDSYSTGSWVPTLTITSGGLVGINTDTPGTNHNLEILGNASAYAILNVKSQSLGHGSSLELGAVDDDDYGNITQFASAAGGNYSGRMRFIAGGTETFNLVGGNAGVGEASPDVRLHVTETIDTAYTVDTATTDANNLLKLENPSTTANAFAGMQLRTGNGADMYVGVIQQSGNAGDLYVTNQNSPNKEIVRLKSTGLVGVGTDAPESELHVMESKTGGSSHASSQITLERSGTNYLQFLTANDGTSGILFGDVADNDGVKIVYDHNVDRMLFNTGTATRLQLTNNGGFWFNNGELVEKVNITAGKLSDNNNINLADGMVHYFTTQETTTCTVNIRVDGSTTLNSVMDAGDVVTVTVITTAAAAGYSQNWTIDNNAVTEEWVGGSAPSAGGSDGLDIYVLTIICTHASNTGDSGFKVIANLTNAT